MRSFVRKTLMCGALVAIASIVIPRAQSSVFGAFNTLNGLEAVVSQFLKRQPRMNSAPSVFLPDYVPVQGRRERHAFYEIFIAKILKKAHRRHDVKRAQPSDIIFYLYTNASQRIVSSAELLEAGNTASVEASSLDAAKPLFVLIHGWAPTGRDGYMWQDDAKDILVTQGAHNVVVLDWVSLSPIHYFRAALAAEYIGHQVAELLLTMQASVKGLDPAKVHIIGYSLGAQIAGAAGKYFQQHSTMGQKLARITGLDPAGPYFDVNGPRVRLDPSDADFVDALHSNGGAIALGYYAYRYPLAHQDVYLNNGRDQPGCGNLLTSVAGILAGQVPLEAAYCSHTRAYQFLLDLMRRHETVLAYPCSSYSKFMKGECLSKGASVILGADPSARGSYFILTQSSLPLLSRMVVARLNGVSRRNSGKLELVVGGDEPDTRVPLLGIKDIFTLGNGTVSRLFSLPIDMRIDSESYQLKFSSHFSRHLSSARSARASGFKVRSLLLTDVLQPTQQFSECDFSVRRASVHEAVLTPGAC